MTHWFMTHYLMTSYFTSYFYFDYYCRSPAETGDGESSPNDQILSMDLEIAYRHCTFKLTVIKEFEKVQVQNRGQTGSIFEVKFWGEILGCFDEILNLNFGRIFKHVISIFEKIWKLASKIHKLWTKRQGLPIHDRDQSSSVIQTESREMECQIKNSH